MDIISESRSYLLIPMQPTPNGRLHIGHAAGPYLRADALARSLRRDGNHVAVITGSDAYENWVMLDGLESGRSARETCAHFHELIRRDLGNIDIELDTWVDPLHEDHAEHYCRLHEDLLRDLMESGQAKLERERIPLTATGHEVVGTWILGLCPTCRQPCSGNTCVFCGDHFQPEEVIDPRSRLDQGELNWCERQNWFLTPRDRGKVLKELRNTGLLNCFLEAPKRYISRRRARIRLSHPGHWGIASPLAPPGSVLSNTYFGYALYCGEVYARTRNTMENPLLKNSLGTKVIGLFGSDNSIAGLVAPFAIGLASGRFRSFDYVNVNHMLYFEGRKCSTSKRHGIWVSELLEQTSVTSDELRYYLFHAPLDESISDVTTEGLVASVNKLRDWLRDRLMPTQRLSGSNWSAALLSRLEYALKEQNRALQPNHVHLKKAVEVMDSWIYSPNMDFYEPAIASTWLAGTALLGEPIIPYLASRIWKQLGLPNQPRTAALATCLSPSDQLSVTSREPIAESEIRPYIHYEVGFEI